MGRRIAVRGEHEVWEVEAPDGRWKSLLDEVVWGTHGLRYQLLNVDEILSHWAGSRFLELRREDQLLAVFVGVPRRYEVEGFGFDAIYRSMLAVRAGTAGAGLGKIITEEARRIWLDEAEGPVLVYGFIEVDNERSMKLQQRLGYASLGSFEATVAGTLRPARIEGLTLAKESDRDEVIDRIQRFWAGHALGDLDQSLTMADYWVLRRGGSLVAGALALPKPLALLNLPGLDGRLLMATSPVIGRLSPFFAVNPHRQLWAGHLFFDQPGDWQDLMKGLQHTFSAASLVMYLDPQGPNYRRLQEAGLGLIHKLAPSPKLEIMAGHKGLPDHVLAAIRKGPVWYSPLDSA